MDNKKESKARPTRLIKVYCPSDRCGYNIRMSLKWIKVGIPSCHNPNCEFYKLKEMKIEGDFKL